MRLHRASRFDVGAWRLRVSWEGAKLTRSRNGKVRHRCATNPEDRAIEMSK